MSYTSPLNRGSAETGLQDSASIQQLSLADKGLSSVVEAQFKALSITTQTPKPHSEAQFKEWERLFAQKISSVFQNDPHPALLMPNTPFSVWVTQELFLLVSNLGVKDDFIRRLIPNPYRQSYPTVTAKSFKEDAFFSVIAERQLDVVLADIKNFLDNIVSESFKEKKEKEQVIKIFTLLHHLESADTEVLKRIWLSDLSIFIPKTAITSIEPDSQKQTANELVRSLNLFWRLFIEEPCKINFELSAKESPLDKILSSRTILNGNFECIEREISFNNFFHELILALEKNFDRNEKDPSYNLDASVVYIAKSLCISICNLQRQLIVQEIIERKCCGPLEEKMIASLADIFLGNFASLSDCFIALGWLKDSAEVEWQFYQKLILDLQEVVNGAFKQSLGLLINHFDSNTAMQGLLLCLFDLEDIVEVYLERLNSLESYKRHQVLFDTGTTIAEPAFAMLFPINEILKKCQRLLGCMWALSRDKLPCSGKLSERSEGLAAGLIKFFELKSKFDQATGSSPPAQNGSLTSKSARNARKRKKFKQKKQAIPSKVFEPSISKAGEAVTTAVTLEERKTKPNLAEVVNTAVVVPSKKQQKRARQAKRAEKEASMSPIQLLPTKGLKVRTLFDFLADKGWTESRQNGSHVIMKHSAFRGKISVPNHSTLKEGTAKALMDQIHKLQSGSTR